jgi:hypothetical protein
LCFRNEDKITEDTTTEDLIPAVKEKAKGFFHGELPHFTDAGMEASGAEIEFLERLQKLITQDLFKEYIDQCYPIVYIYLLLLRVSPTVLLQLTDIFQSYSPILHE